MKAINRLETTWTPEWDLGLQYEFGFLKEEPKRKAELPVRKSGWDAASAEVLGRRASMDRRLGREPSSVGAIIAYFETLSGSEE